MCVVPHFPPSWKAAELDLDVVDESGRSPLHVACLRGNVDAVSLLVGKGANVDLRDFKGLSPLHMCAILGLKECCQFCLFFHVYPPFVISPTLLSPQPPLVFRLSWVHHALCSYPLLKFGAAFSWMVVPQWTSRTTMA